MNDSEKSEDHHEGNRPQRGVPSVESPSGEMDASDEVTNTGVGDSEPEVPEAPGGTSIYVRRTRIPALGFWVALALAVPAVVALVISPFFDFVDLGGVFNFVLFSVVFVGLPLAGVAALVDSIIHRTSKSRDR